MGVQNIRKKRKSNKCPSGLKKAPQAPRRFKSPYILFSISKIQSYKRIHKNAKVTSFSSLISKEWKSLSEQEKNEWNVAAEQDKLRYNTEKSLYKGPWHVSSDRPRKDPNAPKRPPSAFLNYSRTRRAEIIEENPDVKNTDVSKLLGMEWKAMPQEIRQPHIDKEAQERKVYHTKMSAWRKQQQYQQKEIVASAQDMSSLMRHQEIVAETVHTAPFPRSSPLTTQTKPISVPSYGATLIPPRTGNTAFQGSASFSTPDCISKDARAFLTDQTLMNQGACPSLVRPETMDSENIDTTQYHPISTTRNTSAFEMFRFQTDLPAPPFDLSEVDPTNLVSLSCRSVFASTPVHPSNIHSTDDWVISTKTAISPDYPLPEPTPVSPLQSPPRRVSTTQYQELFFPQVWDDVETDSITNINPLEPEYFNFLLNSTMRE